jgi:hypothetical protein
VVQSYGRIPLFFERNAGQAADKSAAWVGSTNGYRMALSATGATITPAAPGRSDIVRLQFLNARPEATAKALEPLPGKTNYLIGRDPKRWLRNLETYGRIEYQNVYDGIDVTWYGNQGQLEYDFLVKPGADPNRIRLRFEGTRKLALEADGDVRIESAAGAMKLRLPEVSQEAEGAPKPVQGRYVLRAANEIGFALAGYDKSKPLVIDPTLVYGTYFGSDGLSARAIVTDAEGNVYIGGGNAAVGLPLANALQRGSLGSGNVWVAKFDPAGTTLIYSTYVGGSGSDNMLAQASLAVTASGELIATGYTSSRDFPLVNATQSEAPAPSSAFAFTFKLNAAGNGFVYSTYLGANAWRAVGWGVATDAAGDTYIAGEVDGPGLATTARVYQSTYGGGWSDGFVIKLGPRGALLYSTLMGGAGEDQAEAIAVDLQGNAYIAGNSGSSSFPNSPPGARTTGAGGLDTFVAKLSPDASRVDWLTFLGTTGSRHPTELVRDTASGKLYVAGSTTSTDLPTTAGVIQPASRGPAQGFIASVNPDGMSFGFVTYLGGGKEDSIQGLALTPFGLVVAGWTTSVGFPVANAIQPAFAGLTTSLYASTNSGASWTPADAGLPASVAAISPDPSNASTMLAASGDYSSSIMGSAGSAWFRTANGGASWTRSGASPVWLWWRAMGAQFVRTPANPAVVYVCYPYTDGQGPPGVVTSDFFAFGSSDDGATWRLLAAPPAASGDWLVGLAVSPTDANTILEVTLSGAVFRSTDGGASFTQVSTLPSGFGWNSPMSVASSPDGSVFAAVMQNVYKSTDFGNTWTEASGIPEWQGMGPIAVSASNPDVVYAAATWPGTLYRSIDGGVNWSAVTSPGLGVYFPADLLAVAPSNPQVVYVASGGQVEVSANGGTTWSSAASLPGPIWAIAVSPSDPTVVYAAPVGATSDGFVAEISADGKEVDWSTFYSGSNGAPVSGVAATLDPEQVWIAGGTSPGLPITRGAYSSRAYGGAAFLARIADTTAPCTYELNPSFALCYGAQTTSFTVTAPSGCAWTATPSDSSWITIQSGTRGSASGVVSVALAANQTGSTRSGRIAVNGETFAIEQAAASCTYAVAGGTNVPASGGSVSITVTAPQGCPWNVVPGSALISVVSGGWGTGNGTVTLSVAPNDGVVWYSPTVQVGPQTVTLQEANACSYSLSPQTLSGDAASGIMSVTANLAGCSWSPQSDAAWLSVSGSGVGSGTFPYSVTENDTGAVRSAHVTLDHRQFTVTQAPL